MADTLDSQISEAKAELAKLKESIRIAKQSLAGIDPKYEMNKAYIAKLNTQIEADQTASDSLVNKIDSLQKQKDNATAKPAAVKTNTETTNKRNDDAASAKGAATSASPILASSSNRTYNPLGKFSSYTYKLSLYMVSSDAVTTHNTTGVWNTKQLQLVAQSAGVNTNLDSPRATGFDFDYYIDNLVITSAVGAGSAGFSGTTTEITFDVYEPYGMTFPTKLIAAAKAMQPTNPAGSPSVQLGGAMSQFYLLVIRFLGYDEHGNIVTAPAAALGTDNKTDDLGLFERAYPIVINEMKTKLDNKIVRYAITATPNSEKVGLSQFTGTVGEQVTISGDTVGDVLSSGVTSLVSILNKKEAELVKNKKKQVADEYEIKFEDLSTIEGSLLVDKNHYVPSQTPLVGVPGAVNVRVAESGQAATVSKQKRSIQINAGTRIPQAIEQVISQSTYITDCLNVINKEETQAVQENDPTSVKNAAPREFAWFTITPQVTPLKKDEQLNVQANKIIYYVKKYSMPFIRSPYFENKPGYPGPHKIYNYWYTGKNEGMMSFDVTYNNLYNNIANLFGSGNVKNKDNLPMRLSSSSGGDSQGKPAGTSEETASFKSWLYSSDELQKASIKIYGDPDFLMTASYGPFSAMDQNNPGTDAPINPLNGQVFIEVDIRSVNDYSDVTGLIKPESNLIFWDYSKELEKKTEGRMVLIVVSVRSRFSRGVFTQEFPDLALPTNLDAAQNTNGNNDSQREAVTTNATKARSTYAATDPRRVDAPKQTPEDDNSFVSPEQYQTDPKYNGASNSERTTPAPVGRGGTRTYDMTNKTRRIGG